MSLRARQLLLEILLLSEKYSDRDISWVREQLASQNHKGDKILNLLKALPLSDRTPPNRNNQPASEHVSKTDIDPSVKKQNLVNNLMKNRTTNGVRRAENVAQRLKITLKGQTHEELISDIVRALDKLPTKELVSFVRPYKDEAEVDDAYIGLANELMKPSIRK